VSSPINATKRTSRPPFLFRPLLSADLLRQSSNIMADGEQWHTISSIASTPNSADSLGEMLSPSRMNLPARKRSHSKHLDGALLPIEDNKSRRTSPSPFLPGPSTPSTVSSGYGPMLGEGYFDLTLSVHTFTASPVCFPLHSAYGFLLFREPSTDSC
jgi:hypothetical protein